MDKIKYRKIYKNFHKALEECKGVSRQFAGIPSPSSAHFYASLLFTKLCTGSVSILSICPPPNRIGRSAHWDCASVAALTRGIIETYLVFFYLCIEECDKQEWEARWRLMNLHDHMSRLKMFKVMDGADEEVTKFESYTDKVKCDLEETKYFKLLCEKQQKHYLRGNNAFFKNQDDLIEAMGGSVDEFRFRYRFLSNHTHSYPMGFYRMAELGRGTSVESKSEVNCSSLCLIWVTEYLEKAKNDFSGLFSSQL